MKYNICKISIILICCVVFLFNCSKNKGIKINNIEINPNEAKDEINLSEFVDSVKCIKLQTDSNCVIGRLHDIIIKEKYIYALDVSQQILFVFDKNGKYISKMDKRGKGPEEYEHMGPIFIDDNEKYIELINYNGKKSNVLKYSNLAFNLLEKKSMPQIIANSCRKADNTYYFATQQIENIVNDVPTNASIIIVKEDKVIKKLFNKTIISKHNSFSPNCESFTKNDKDELFVSVMYDNTFYKLNNIDVQPIYTINFGKYGIDNTVGNKSIEEQLQYIKKTNGLASFPVLNINNSMIMSFSYYFKEDNKERFLKESDFRQYILLKNSNKKFHTKRIKNDITSFPRNVYLSSYFFSVSHEVWYKDYLVDVIIPGYYFYNGETKTMVKGLGEITINDNPIIILMKLKKELR